MEKIINDGSNVIKTVRDVVKKDKIPDFNDNLETTLQFDSKFVLSDYPQFYNSNTINFTEILQDTLASMSKAIYQIVNPVSKKAFNEYVILGNTLRSFEYYSSKSPDEIKHEFENKWSNPQNWNDFKINIDGNYEIIQIRTGEYANNFTNRFKELLFGFCAEMNQINSDEYSSRIRYLQNVYGGIPQLKIRQPTGLTGLVKRIM